MVYDFNKNYLYRVSFVLRDVHIPCIPQRDESGNLYYVREYVNKWVWGVEL